MTNDTQAIIDLLRSSKGQTMGVLWCAGVIERGEHIKPQTCSRCGNSYDSKVHAMGCGT